MMLVEKDPGIISDSKDVWIKWGPFFVDFDFIWKTDLLQGIPMSCDHDLLKHKVSMFFQM